MHSLESTITLWSAIAAGLSLLAIVIAWRGRLIDDHPLCRKCGFDLFGLPEASTNCPECGRDITRPRARRLGNRQPRKPLFWIGSFLLLIAASLLVMLAIGRVRHVNWNQYEPVSWLIRETAADDAATRDAAMNEIMARLTAGKLSDASLRELAHAALADQKDRSQPWFARWGAFIDTARAQGRFTREEWHQYCRQAADCVDFEIRPTIHKGHPIPFRLISRQSRGMPLGVLIAGDPTCEIDNLTLPISPQNDQDHFNWISPGSRCDFVAEQTEESIKKLADGEHEVTISLPIAFIDSHGSEEVAATVTRRIRQVSDDRPLVRPVADAKQQDIVRSNLSVVLLADRGTQSVTVYLASKGARYDIACAGSLRIGSSEFDLGLILLPAGRSRHISIPLAGALQFRDPSSADVVLEPSAEAAECSVDSKEFWGESIFFKNVRIARWDADPLTR
ncbi:MAG TPA: hypothetical protein VH475_00385 [Tepidisphaeraceae bacterium]|jgi:hypothetical protein